MDVGSEIVNLFIDAATEVGYDIRHGTEELRRYTAERTAILASLVGQAGYVQAVEAEAHNVAVKAALRLDTEAKAGDAKLLGILVGALSIGAKILTGGVV